MSQRDAVAILYVVGAVVTAGGVLFAYLTAATQKRALDRIVEWSRELPEVDLGEIVDEALRGDEAAQAIRAVSQTARDDERARLLRGVGIHSATTWDDLELPAELWSRRTSLGDLLASFRSGGMTALTGLLLLTAASVWSLYLPAA